MSTEEIGFIGLGVMGHAMVGHLLDGGHRVAVFDRRPEAVDSLVGAGAIGCSDAGEVARRAGTVLVSLPSTAALAEVVAALVGAGESSVLRTFVDLSTSGTEAAEAAAAALGSLGVAYLDAPVSGGPQGARNATLTIMAAGERPLFERLEPLLRLLGSNVLHVGELPGQGQLTKVINNQLSATVMAATGEALALGVKGGLDPSRLLEAINLSSGRSTASQDKYPRCVVTRTFDYGFRLRLMAKDTALCMEEAARVGAPMPLGSAVRQLWAIADAQGSDQDDFTVIAKLFEEWAGVTIGSATAP